MDEEPRMVLDGLIVRNEELFVRLDVDEVIEGGLETIAEDGVGVAVEVGFTTLSEMDAADARVRELVVDDDENRDGESDVDEGGGADEEDSEALRTGDDDVRLEDVLSVAIEPDVVIEIDDCVLGDARLPGGTLIGSMVIELTVGLLEDPMRLELVADNLELSMS
ncbi:hypothetical protein CGMCC3_g15916 [Colletotrichum fructicola]|nr:uncharacterized protein CGMCC3_g15916 [Colletotrichum fructicola]KAE9567922.1 hypothetical protein CGMCC3_g15916 [Colletotrichum fructicola]